MPVLYRGSAVPKTLTDTARHTVERFRNAAYQFFE